jgi:hypothetical protein
VSTDTETRADNVRTVIRPTWTPKTEEQSRALDAAIEAANEADEADEKAWAAIKRARDAGVPDEVVCRRTNRSRSTLHRKYGPRGA